MNIEPLPSVFRRNRAAAFVVVSLALIAATSQAGLVAMRIQRTGGGGGSRQVHGVVGGRSEETASTSFINRSLRTWTIASAELDRPDPALVVDAGGGHGFEVAAFPSDSPVTVKPGSVFHVAIVRNDCKVLASSSGARPTKVSVRLTMDTPLGRRHQAISVDSPNCPT
jgi:hypothetical protein